MNNRIKRALISVYDKTGIAAFAKALHAAGVEILSTGGTAALLKKEGVPVTEVSRVTRFPEMLDGRVKTLHPALHAGILALRDKPGHRRALAKKKIRPIDLVVVNLYPFREVGTRRAVSLLQAKRRERDLVEMIDIGGPAMLRAAAKNFRFVAAVCDPADYDVVLRELEDSRSAMNRAPTRLTRAAPTLSEDTRKKLAAKAFDRTASYDRMIADYFNVGMDFRVRPDGATGGHGGSPLPDRLTLDFKKIQDLRYGENPHQKGALYADWAPRKTGILQARQLHGKELSFNNLLDLDTALEMVSAFRGARACAIIKHASPCGFAVGRTGAAAFRGAWASDPLSAFGSVVGLNAVVDERTAGALLKSGFIECVLAAGFTRGALRRLKVKKNLRLLSVPMYPANVGARRAVPLLDFKKVSGGLLVQERDRKDPNSADLKCVTRASPTRSQEKDLLFAFKICRYVKSNAIVVVKGGVTVGLGMGQPSRVDACFTALKKAGPRAVGAVLASDGFFPKPDSILLAKKAGIRAIIQPGGSIQDRAVIDACDRAKISMVFTRIRHFKH